MVFLCFSYGFPMAFPCFPLVFPWCSYGFVCFPMAKKQNSAGSATKRLTLGRELGFVVAAMLADAATRRIRLPGLESLPAGNVGIAMS